jgi:hypothetical protein
VRENTRYAYWQLATATEKRALLFEGEAAEKLHFQ